MIIILEQSNEKQHIIEGLPIKNSNGQWIFLYWLKEHSMWKEVIGA